MAPERGRGTWRIATLIVMALAGAALLFAIILTLGEASRQRDNALKLQSHSYDVMILARTLSGTIARSEAALGRYVISGDRGLGQLYYEDWRRAGEQIARLSRFTHDNARQNAAMAQLHTAYASRGEELSLTALSTNYGKNSQALARYYRARQAPALADIDRSLEELIATERDLLQRRTSTALASVASANRVAGVLAIFGVLIVLGAIALGWMTVRALGERAEAEAKAGEEHERAEALAVAVTEATIELRRQEGKLRQVQKMEAVGQLTGGIAHDFNNMLAVVLGGLELARRHAADPAAAARHIDSATEGANRAAALTRRLLAFSREESLRPETMEAGALVGGMRELLDRTLGDAVTIVARDEADGWRVHADRVQLENVLLNLAVNARDAMEGRGTLTIVTAAARLAEGDVADCAPGEYVGILVADTGCGMTPDVLDRAFEPFYTTKPVGKGTGLGLSQIFAFVRQQGGGIDIASAPGAGTVVTLFLPRAEDPAPALVPEPTSPAETGRGCVLEILVVEDDPRVLAATVEALTELGHCPIPCDDPHAAPSLLERHAGIGLVLTDVLMPRMTGPELIASLPPRFAHLPVVFVTGFAGESSAADFGGHHVLRKPFTLAGLERAVTSAVADRAPFVQQVAAA